MLPTSREKPRGSVPQPPARLRRLGPPAIGILLAALLAVALGCRGDSRPAGEGAAPGATPESGRATPWLRDEATSLGLDFVHRTGAAGAFHPPEIMGPGAALVDLDQDGDLDLVLVQGGVLGAGAARTAGDAPRVYRNLLVEGGHLAFVPGPPVPPGDYGQGIAAGDFDGDGPPDLCLTAFGTSRLLRNRGGLALEDVTVASRTAVAGWSVPAVFLDFDRDGRLDLYVGRYLDFTWQNRVECHSLAGVPDYCSPATYRGLSGRLFHNQGDGRFRDVTAASGLARVAAPALGAVAADLDGDGWLDLYVANDGQPNHLWMNQRDGSFDEQALVRGVAMNGAGLAEAGMGIAAADLDGDLDLDLDLVVTNLTGETNTFYRNRGRGEFEDVTQASGIGPPSQAMTGFGVVAADLDGDLALDLFVANGAVRAVVALAAAGDPFPYHQPAQILRGDGAGRFREQQGAVAPWPLDLVGRGVAAGDIDNDGDVDLLVAAAGAAPRLLVNHAGDGRPWVGLRLVTGRRDALGAEVILRRRSGRPLLFRVHTDASYASASDPRVVAALADPADLDRVEVHWPDGTRERFPAPPALAYTSLVQGRGEAP